MLELQKEGGLLVENNISLDKLRVDVHNSLKLWHRSDSKVNSLEYLQVSRQAYLRGQNNPRKIANQILQNGLDLLEADHAEYAELIRKRFIEQMSVYAVANRFNISQTTAYRRQEKAIEYLAIILKEQNSQIVQAWYSKLEQRLEPISYIELFGVDKYLKKSLELLVSQEPPWFISFEGLGGIGKTVLADHLVRHPDLFGKYYDVVWVTARLQNFLPGVGIKQLERPILNTAILVDNIIEQLDEEIPLSQSLDHKIIALTKIFKQGAHLIIVDNLETADDHRALIPFLQKLVNPSKVLLTSRHSLRAYSGIYCLRLQELNVADSMSLIRREAALRGLVEVADASEKQLNDIYNVAGGNPLALKLVIGQASILPLVQVLESLKQAQAKHVDELFTYIYWQAWHLLTASSQQALLAMPLGQRGGVEQLLAVSRLEIDDFNQAIQQLVNLSLVEVKGGLTERRYSIHRLTETFLLNEALKWNQK